MVVAVLLPSFWLAGLWLAGLRLAGLWLAGRFRGARSRSSAPKGEENIGPAGSARHAGPHRIPATSSPGACGWLVGFTSGVRQDGSSRVAAHKKITPGTGRGPGVNRQRSVGIGKSSRKDHPRTGETAGEWEALEVPKAAAPLALLSEEIRSPAAKAKQASAAVLTSRNWGVIWALLVSKIMATVGVVSVSRD